MIFGAMLLTCDLDFFAKVLGGPCLDIDPSLVNPVYHAWQGSILLVEVTGYEAQAAALGHQAVSDMLALAVCIVFGGLAMRPRCQAIDDSALYPPLTYLETG